jgi:hypothetical protein
MFEVKVQVDYDLLLVQLYEGKEVLLSSYYPSLSDAMHDVQVEILKYIGKEWS